jgi:hypothetical protein
MHPDNRQETRTQAETSRWLRKYEALATHAITLTYNHAKVYGFLEAFSDGSTPTSDHMVERYKKGMSRFINVLDRKLFGHSSKRHGNRMLFIPVLEGLIPPKFPHWHCTIGIPEDRYERLESIVQVEWENINFGGRVTKVERIYSSIGWLDYTNKCNLSPQRQGVYWECVREPDTAAIS